MILNKAVCRVISIDSFHPGQVSHGSLLKDGLFYYLRRSEKQHRRILSSKERHSWARASKFRQTQVGFGSAGWSKDMVRASWGYWTSLGRRDEVRTRIDNDLEVVVQAAIYETRKTTTYERPSFRREGRLKLLGTGVIR